MKDKRRMIAVTVFSAVLVFLFPGLASPQEPFYKGKTITLVRGAGPGGTGEMRVRALIPYLQKYIPGHPTIVMEFMPGAGGRKSANYIYNRAPRDGLTIGTVSGGAVEAAVLGMAGVQYDLDKLIFLGSPDRDTHHIFVTRGEAGLNTLDKLRTRTGVRIGSQAVGHTIYNLGRLFAYFLGLNNPIFITGYSGAEIDLALMRGEVDARVSLPDTVIQRTPDWIEKGLVHFHAVIEWKKGDKHPHFAHLPEIENFARSEKERRLLTVARNMKLVGPPLFLPPGTPPDRVEILAEAMRRAMEDPGFRKDFTKLVGGEPVTVTREEQVKAIAEIPHDPDTMELIKRFSGPDPLPTR